MGRDLGFIAATETLANSVVELCLIAEINLERDNPKGLIEAAKKRLSKNNHAVIVVAEGAGQRLFANAPERNNQPGTIPKQTSIFFFATRSTDVSMQKASARA